MQWVWICLPMQGTQVQSLVQEDPTCRGAAKPVHHNCWACALEPMSHNCWAQALQLLKPACLEPVLCNKRSPYTATKSSPRSLQLEKARAQQQRPTQPKNKNFFFGISWHGFLWVYPVSGLLSFLICRFMSLAKFGVPLSTFSALLFSPLFPGLW